MSSASLAFGRKYLQMSIVKRVLELLKIEVRELIRAAKSAASMMPFTPKIHVHYTKVKLQYLFADYILC